MMERILDPNSVEDYRLFLRIKGLPSYEIRGRVAKFPDEYASRLGMQMPAAKAKRYTPKKFLFDYQKDIARLAIKKKRFCVFADCGLGKTLIFTEYARHVQKELGRERGILLISPAMVVNQTLDECQRWYGGDLAIDKVPARNLQAWLDDSGGRIGITNYEALKDETTAGKLGALILDESSMLKSHYGKWGTKCLELGQGLEWKLAGTGTPAPNDRIEYANHAVLMDAFPTVNSFLAKYFVNRGQTGERWELKEHALKGFYRALSHWCVFLTDPATYGWHDNTQSIPPIHVHIHDVDLTSEQQQLAYSDNGQLFATELGGIASRASYGSIAKGHYRGRDVDTLKPGYIRSLIETWPEESTIVWCIYNKEQERIAKVLPDAVSITGATPMDVRMKGIDDFKSGRVKTLITKPKILGFGLNLERATRQVFSGLQDSYESYYQAVKRSNRVGSKKPLNVHIPITDIERPMIDTVLRKAARVQHDTRQQEQLFKEFSEL